MKTLASLLFLAACGGAAAPAATVEHPAPLPTPPVTPNAEPPPRALEGTYLLDTDATVADMEPEIARQPADQRDATRQIARSLFERMHVTLELRADGTLHIDTTMPDTTAPSLPPKIEGQEGTWKRTDEGLVLTAKGKDMRCTKAAARLTCEEVPPAKLGAVVFVQQR